MLDVTFGEDGRYNVSQDDTGYSHAFESGQPRDVLGDNLILRLAYDLDDARETLGKLAQSVWGGPDKKPDVYDDYDAMCHMSKDCERVCEARRFSLGEAVFSGGGPLSLFVKDSDSKYTVVQRETGAAHAYRYGNEWRDITGDDLILSLGGELSATREVLYKLSMSTFGPDVGNPRNVPDVYDDRKTLDLLDVYDDKEALAILEESVRNVMPNLEFGSPVSPIPGR